MGLTCLGCLSAEALDKGGESLALQLLAFGELEIEGLALAPLTFERGIAAAIEGELAGLQMQDRIDRVVQKITVMADDHHRARIARDMVLKPERALEIEVVGRLVEQEKVGFREQSGGECHPHPPAPGEFGAWALLFGMRKAQARQDFGRAGRRRMSADVGEPGLDFRDPMRIVRGLGFGKKARPFLIGLEHDCEETFGTVRCLLREPADAGSRRTRDIAVLGRDLTHDGAEQRCLAGAVAANQAHARAVRNARGGAFQQKLAGYTQRNVVEHEHGRLLADRA